MQGSNTKEHSTAAKPALLYTSMGTRDKLIVTFWPYWTSYALAVIHSDIVSDNVVKIKPHTIHTLTTP